MELQHSSGVAPAPVGDEADGGADRTRKTELLHTADALFATSGLRTSLQEIGDAAGILAGSLYHHFESKEAIFVELLRRYHADLDRVAEAAQSQLDDIRPEQVVEKIYALGSAIARTAVRHRTALHMSFREAPSQNPELIALVQRRPTALQDAMLQTLRAGRWSGYIRSDVDLPPLADRICQTMLHVGLDVIRHNASTDSVAALSCRVLLEGLSAPPYLDQILDGSAAFATAQQTIDSWAQSVDIVNPDDKVLLIRAVARREFGRKGYELTTIRDIAAAAGLGAGSVYWAMGSKEELLASIMQSFGEKIATGWIDVLKSDSTPSEQLDALIWIQINALVRFPDEFAIQLAWMRQSPPDTPNPGWQFGPRMKQLRTLLNRGLRSGDMQIDTRSKELLSRCVIDLMWLPENIVRTAGTRKALLLGRDTVLRGVLDRSVGDRTTA
jgi:AcrR family transcriptional regulator